ncbi:hypothetical protein Tco_0797681 [Tanacetum coccineum]
MGLLRTELEKVKEEKEGFEFKIAKFEKSAKDLDQLLANQITDKSKKGFGYNVVPSPHPLILNRPTPLDLSYSGLEEFKQPEVNEYGPRDSSLKPTTGCDKESDNSKENTDDSLKQQQKTDSKTSSVKSPLKVDKDWKEKFFCPANHVREEEPKKARENNDAPIIEDWVSDDEDEVEPIPKVEKKTVIPTATKKEFVKPEKPVRRSVRYAEMYRSQRPRGNQRNWNGQKSNQLGCNFVFNNKACFICGSFDHIQYSCPKTSYPSAHKHMAPKAVLMKTGLKSVNIARPVNTVRSVNTGRPFSTARSFNTVRPSYTAHPKSIVHCARPRTYFQNQAQLTVYRPFYKRTALTKRSYYQRFNTGRQNVNTVRARGFNVVKPSACWVWRPIKPNGASLSNSQLNDKGFVDSGCSRHMTRNIAHLSDFKDFDGGSAGFHQVIDFLNRSHICYALTKKPDINATIDGHSMTITEVSLRRHLKLDDQDVISSIPNSEIFEQLALMGYHTDSDNPKKTAWEQFSSNIATAVICLATNRKYNFSRMIFEHMVSNISSPHKFFMYPRFIQICLDMQRNQLQQHSRTYPVPSLSIKVFNNMKRPTKGYSGQEVALFPTMLDVSEPSTSPSRITSLPSHSPEPSPSPEPSFEHSPDHTTAAPTQPSPTQPSPTQPSTGAEHHFPTPHDSPLHVVHSHGSDEGSLKLNDLTNLVTKLSERIGGLEDDLRKTKKTYSSAFTKLILRVKKLEARVKIGKARKRAKVVLFEDDEDVEDDSSKQGRKLSDAEVQEKASTETEPIIQEVTPTKVIQDQESSEKGSAEVCTAGATKGTASEVPVVSTTEENISTA